MTGSPDGIKSYEHIQNGNPEPGQAGGNGIPGFFAAQEIKQGRQEDNEHDGILIILLPALFYFLRGKKPWDAVASCLPWFGVAILYMLIRFNAVGAPGHS